jgi:Fe-only nitrogenase accessory protein AnfO
MQIAALVDQHDHTLPFGNNGTVKIFQQTDNQWICRKTVTLDLHDNVSLALIRSTVHQLAKQLNECKNIVLRRSPGIFNAILQEELGIKVWNAGGSVYNSLQQIAGQAAADSRKMAPACNSCVEYDNKIYPTPVGDVWSGLFFINLIEVQQKNTNLNSKEILLPFLQQKHDLVELEIVCLHVPKWLHDTNVLHTLGIEVNTEDRHDGVCHAFVTKLLDN